MARNFIKLGLEASYLVVLFGRARRNLKWNFLSIRRYFKIMIHFWRGDADSCKAKQEKASLKKRRVKRKRD